MTDVAGQGGMAARVRGFDWSATRLGPIDRWPTALRIHVETVLASRFPAALFWGSDFLLIYNDGYVPLLGDKPEALGRPLRVVWADAWEALKPMAEKALAGESTFIEDFRLETTRRGHPEDAYFTFCYSPVFDEHGSIVGVLDIVVETTGKVLAERRMGEEQARLQRLLQQMPGFIAVLSGPEHVYADTNQGHSRLVGGRSVLGRTVQEAVPEAVAQGFVELLDEVYGSGRPFAGQGLPLKLVDTPGTNLIDLALEPVRDLAGTVTGVFVGGYDVTERSLAEARLRELNAELEREVVSRAMSRGRTWDVSPELLGVLNADGYFEASNPAWGVVLGWSEQEVGSAVFLEFVHPDDLAATRSAWADVVRGDRRVLHVENRFRRKQGGWRWLSWILVLDEGKLYGSARDIQEEKEREATLDRRTVERDTLARIVETTGTQIQVVDLDFRYLALNRAASSQLAALFGFHPRVGDNLMDLLGRIPDAADREAGIRLWRRAMAGESFTAQHEFGNDDRERRHYEMTFEVLRDADGRQTGAFVTSVDVTDRVREHSILQQAQEALRQSQKMEAVGQLTGGLAHDFNNLLAAISGSLQMLKRRSARGQYEDLDRFVNLAQRSTDRAAALTQRLLAFARRQNLDPRPIDVGVLVHSMEELVRRSVGPDVRVDVVVRAGLWTTRVDVSQLESALLNLCLNARDAMAPDGGSLTIETFNTRLDDGEAADLEVVPGEYVALSVIDTGMGIAPGTVKRIFDPFFTTKPIGQGTGLGLSMVYGFARQSGGAVGVRTRVGHGTQMRVYLPRCAEAAQTPALAVDSDELTEGSGETIVLIEDEDAVRELIGTVLKEAGYRVLPAADGLSGLRVLDAAARVDLLVTDVGLPGGLNGRQVADAARNRRPGLRVLFLTGYAETATLGSGLGEAGLEIMTKPFDVVALTARIREMLAPGTAAPVAGLAGPLARDA